MSDLNAVYSERNNLAIGLAKMALLAGLKAGRGFDDDPKKDWAPEWRHIVYVDLPNGSQVSWHMSPKELPLLDSLPAYEGGWDGTFLGREDWTSGVR